MKYVFNFEKAKIIVSKHQWLIDKHLDTVNNRYPIKHIVIVLPDERQYVKFFRTLFQPS